MFKKWFYRQFAKLYQPEPNPKNPLLKNIAYWIEKILGQTEFDYGSIKVKAGPYAFLDHHIIRGYNINPYVTSAISQYLSEGGIFLDIGANHGVFSLFAAKNPKTKVIAFEPSPRELKRLWQNLVLNDHHNISVLAFGLGSEEKEQEFRLSGADNPGMNSLPAICSSGTPVLCHFSSLVRLMSLDIFSKVRVCKLDVEGQEMFILNSLKSHMHLFKQAVFVIEMHPAHLSKAGFHTDDIYQFFHQAGFIHQYGSDGSHAWEEFFYHPSYTEPLQYSSELI